MAELTANKLLELIKRSGLIEEKRLEAFLDKAAEKAGGTLPDKQESLARLLLEEGLLTEWQAEKLLAGKHKGFRLGKYKLLGQIGKGGMSSVYLAEHVMMRRRVAIKVLPQSRVKDSSYLERFRLEARAVARLDDPNIVRAFDIDSEGSIHYIVMEYVDGDDLHKLVSKNGPLDYDTAADYIAQAANGLQHAHEMGLVHRDIKPANCLLDKHQTVKILDMGLAKLENDEESSLTLANDENVLGTADYLAPEQALNSHGADERADIYSLGCTLYFLLVGKPPFPEGTIPERLMKHQTEEPTSILQFRPDAPLSLVEICAKMMAKKPEHRYQSAGEVAKKLTGWLADRGKKLGGGVIDTDGEDSGVGSGILSRFNVKPPMPTPSSAGISSASRDTTKLSGPDTDAEEDIGLAPIEDEEAKPSKPKKIKAAPDSSPGSSGVLPAHLRKPGVDPPKPEPATKRTIFEEEFAEDEHDPVKLRAQQRSQAQYDPLHPPGYKSPFNRTPAWVWALLGVAGIGLLVLFLSSVI